MRKTLIFLSIIWIASSAKGQINDNAAAAFEDSRTTQKPVLLIFSGSDWCAPCIRLHKTVLSDEQFLLYASDHFILLKADFPQRKKLATETVAQNERLAERYNPKGQFPHLVLLRSDQSVLSVLPYKNQNTEEFITMLSTHFAE